MTDRIHNFSAGPATLPLPVLQQAQAELINLNGIGMSILEISHRSQPFIDIIDETAANIRELLRVPADYEVLFLQGGATTQFSMVPMNFLRGKQQPADYIVTGSWGQKAIKEAKREGEARVVFDGGPNYTSVPAAGAFSPDPKAAYLHYTSNETIQGVQFKHTPDSAGAPLICDASSDFMHRPIEVGKHALIYAGAQKNAGPAGVTIVIARKDLIESGADGLHTMLDYRTHAGKQSMHNTPPTFAIYIVMLVTRWLRDEIGGLAQMEALNEDKAALLYDAIDNSNGFYRPHAATSARSLMNVVWRLPSEELEAEFVRTADASGLSGLKGHRSVGGIRASIYNALPKASVQTLVDFMGDFARTHA